MKNDKEKNKELELKSTAIVLVAIDVVVCLNFLKPNKWQRNKQPHESSSKTENICAVLKAFYADQNV